MALTFSAAARAQEAPWMSVGEAYYARRADCWARFDQGKIKTFSAAVHCADDGLRGGLLATGYPFIDLMDSMLKQHALIAESVDSRKVSTVVGRRALTIVDDKTRAAVVERKAAVAEQELRQAELQARLDAQAVAQERELARLQAQFDAQRRAAALGAAAGMLAPTRSGTFGESLGNGFGGSIGLPPSTYGWPPVVSVAPSQTTCYRAAGQQVICNTQ